PKLSRVISGTEESNPMVLSPSAPGAEGLLPFGSIAQMFLITGLMPRPRGSKLPARVYWRTIGVPPTQFPLVIVPPVQALDGGMPWRIKALGPSRVKP